MRSRNCRTHSRGSSASLRYAAPIASIVANGTSSRSIGSEEGPATPRSTGPIHDAISRSLRFFLVAWFIYRFGPAMREFIDRYFNLLSVAFTVLLIGGFILIKYIL